MLLKRSTLQNDAPNALLPISLNGPQLRTLEAKELIKHIERIYGERKQYKKAPSIKQKEQETQADSIHTRVRLCVRSKLMENIEECLDVITQEIPDFNETSEVKNSETDGELKSL